METEKEYISIAEAAKILGVCRQMVYRYINNGKLICFVNADNGRMVLDRENVEQLSKWRNEPPWTR